MKVSKKFRKVEYKEGESDCDESDVNSSEDEGDTPMVEVNGKSEFNAMRVFDIVSPSLSNSYFRVEINGKEKYIHKQTAGWFFTNYKPQLSADRSKRAIQSSEWMNESLNVVVLI
ncbi:unnamed protein product [Adineta ricciae]|uniref:Uncharacterized protein n=1 Tax=Adineta ricciae TaxID=249248 RepID=A0A816F8B8_ADIRI|nr:unnamed protein product [Adineta ricciae]